jgi:transcriptional regulator with XRE-family HTH domain
MAKVKIRPHPGALAELLKSQSMTQMDAASRSRIDRKTLAKIDHGEEVKLETLQKLANALKVPINHFSPSGSNSVNLVDSQLKDDPEWLSLLLRKVDANGFMEMLWFAEKDHVRWKVNVRRVDDDTIYLLDRLKHAVDWFYTFVKKSWSGESLEKQLEHLKTIQKVTTVLEDLSKHRLAILGANYLSWESHNDTDFLTQLPCLSYVSRPNVLLAVEEYPAHERREKVWQGKVPPKSDALDQQSIVMVNGRPLQNQAGIALEKEWDELEQETLNTQASSEDGNAS